MHRSQRGIARASMRQTILALLPRGSMLSPGEWARRHRVLTAVVWLHVLVVPVYGVLRGQPTRHVIGECSLIAVFAAGASLRGQRPTFRAVMVTMGLVTSSAILTHFSGGLIEMHFHFFVVVATISLYQSWVPFLVALSYVVVHHGLAGTIAPSSVFNHISDVDNAWVWAAVHGGFILLQSAACLTTWRLNELALGRERKASRDMEAALRDLAIAQSISKLGSWAWEPVSGQVWWSDEMYRLFGRDQETFVPTVGTFLEQVAEHDRARIDQLVLAASTGGLPLDFECGITRPDGTTRIVHALGGPVGEETGKAGQYLGTCQDITDRKVLEAAIEHRALHDELTGLPNRKLFLDRLESGINAAARTNGSLALLYVDLDDFKAVNDNLGHEIGDSLLQRVAEQLEATVRQGDTVARLAGDEFAVILQNCDIEGATGVAGDLLAAFAEPLTVASSRVLCRISIGIADWRPDVGPADVLRHADIAMYAAKRETKHCYRVFSRAMEASLTARLELEADLAEAIDHDQLLLHYQPLVDLETGTIEGVEALVRWDHPERGLLPPSEFITIAEQTGLIEALGSWVLRKATSDIRRLQADVGRRVYVSVNVAAPQLHDGFVANVRGALSAAGMDPADLVIEITESCMMAQDAAAVKMLAELRGLGVRVAIDDFGTGYSSLAYLRNLPIDHLKIDRAFVRDITEGPEESALAHSIIKLGEMFGHKVVAEGIETDGQAQTLRRLGCDMGQGYLFQRPTDVGTLTALIGADGDERSAVAV